jgi:hypothetical protein
MNMIKALPICLLPLIFSGCLTNDAPKADIIMPQLQQNTYLSHAKPPQQFGFEVVPVRDGFTFFGRARLHPNSFTAAKMVRSKLPMIEMRGRARRNKMNVLIDMSSPSSWIEFSKSQKFNTQFLGLDDEPIPYRGSYNTGGANAYAGVITQLRINQLFMENVPFFVRMAIGSLGPLARGIQTPPVDAIMGYDNLRNFEFIQFDLRNNSILFSTTAPYTPVEDLLMTTAKIVNHPGFGLVIEGSIFDKPSPIILDFGGNFNFARGDMKVNSTRQVGLGDLVFRQVPTLVLPVHNSPPRAGRKMLEPYLITVCNRLGVVYFERPPQ